MITRNIYGAARVLSARKHRGRDDWRVANLHVPGISTVFPIHVVASGGEGVVREGDFYLNGLEAVATAFAYEKGWSLKETFADVFRAPLAACAGEMEPEENAE